VRGLDLAHLAGALSAVYTLGLLGLCEIASAACDLLQVLGGGHRAHPLFRLPLLAGVLVPPADTAALLWLQLFGSRMMESFRSGSDCHLSADVSCIESGYRSLCFLKLRQSYPRLHGRRRYILRSVFGAPGVPHNRVSAFALVRSAADRLERRVQARALPLQPIDSTGSVECGDTG